MGARISPRSTVCADRGREGEESGGDYFANTGRDLSSFRNPGRCERLPLSLGGFRLRYGPLG